MNGLTTQTSYRHRDNICYCGHDIRFHNVDTAIIGNNVCSLCLTTSPVYGITNWNKHFFMHRTQVLGMGQFNSFQLVRRRAYYTVGNLNLPFINATASVAPPGSNSITINTIVSPVGALIKPGMVFMTRPANVQNQTQFTILNIISGNGGAGSVFAITPTVITNIPAGTNTRVYGSVGTTQGPGCTANNQRAG